MVTVSLSPHSGTHKPHSVCPPSAAPLPVHRHTTQPGILHPGIHGIQGMLRAPLWIALLLTVALRADVAGGTADYRVCGSRYLERHAGALPLPSARPSTASQPPDTIVVGTELDFLVAGDMYLRSGICQYVGEHCYIFVDTAQWHGNGGPIGQAHVDELGELFDRSTPADPERGMYSLLTEAFGTPAPVDGDERIHIFVVRLVDPRLVGFFDPRVATWPDPALRRDVVYLNAQRLITDPYMVYGTLAHEFQHLIHHAFNPHEELWINEGLSGYAEALTGFPEVDPTMVPAFLAQPDLDLTVWSWLSSAAHYGATYLFVAYLAERFGPDLIRALVAEPATGTAGVDAALRRTGWVADFDGVWADWIVANYASDDDRYGYAALRGRRIQTQPSPSPPFASASWQVMRRWGSRGVVVPAGHLVEDPLWVHFDGDEEVRFRVMMYAMRGLSGQVTPMELDAESKGSVQLHPADSVAVIVGRMSQPSQPSQPGGGFRLAAESQPITAVLDETGAVAGRVPVLGPAYPNPFNAATVVPVWLPVAAEVRLSVANILGQEVALLLHGGLPQGAHRAIWDGSDRHGQALSSGLYVIRLQTGEQAYLRKVMLVR